MLGLIEVIGEGKSSTLTITPAGEKLLALDDEDESVLFLNQIAKVQFPSLQHNSSDFLNMNCRPLTITLSFLLEVGPITKEEFGLFVLSTTKPEDLDPNVALLREFRRKIATAQPGLARKKLRSELINARIAEIYAKDIVSGNTFLREGGRDFLKTKRKTVTRDYADSSFRYLLSTGLFRIDPHGKTFSIIDSQKGTARSLVDDLGLGSSFQVTEQETYVSDYLGNLNEPKINVFSLSYQSTVLESILGAKNALPSEVAENLVSIERMDNGVDRQVFLEKLEQEKKDDAIRYRSINLVRNRKTASAEINEFFGEITSRDSDLIDRPLFFEWNTWRALTVLNDAIAVTGNFRTDVDGNPLGTAAGRQADIVVEYQGFWLAVEVTLQSGAKQYSTESESITRHVGQLQAKVISDGDVRPVYGIFLAPKVNETVVNYLLVNSRMNSRIYGGPVKILPVELEKFVDLINKNANLLATSSNPLKEFISSAFDRGEAVAGDEKAWLASTGSAIAKLELTPS
jgi:hypothetical protein